MDARKSRFAPNTPDPVCAKHIRHLIRFARNGGIQRSPHRWCDSSSKRQFIEPTVYRTDSLSNRQFIEQQFIETRQINKQKVCENS